MNHIGNVIKEYRNMLCISRKEVSNNICSEKYLYMIEKGERTPSLEVTRLLGDKMGVDLFKYNEYLDCINPIQVSFFMERFNKFRRENDLNSLAGITEEALLIEDYGKEPWKYEIELNLQTIKILGKGDFINSTPIIQDIIAEMKQKRLHNICLANFYVLLSTCFQMAHDIKNARKFVMLANETIEGKQKISKYLQVIITVKINKITMHYLAGELDSVIEDALILTKYENEMCWHEYSHHTFFYLAFAYYQSGLEEEGIKWFQKALCLMVIHHREMDMYYIASYEIFDVMLRDKRLPKELAQKIRDVYSGVQV